MLELRGKRPGWRGPGLLLAALAMFFGLIFGAQCGEGMAMPITSLASGHGCAAPQGIGHSSAMASQYLGGHTGTNVTGHQEMDTSAAAVEMSPGGILAICLTFMVATLAAVLGIHPRQHNEVRRRVPLTAVLHAPRARIPAALTPAQLRVLRT